MSEDEVLLLDNELARHMISEGFSDFETFNRCTMSPKSLRYSTDYTSVFTRNSVKNTVETTYISPSDHAKLISLRDSKLLLPEDFEVMEFLMSTTTTSKSHAQYSWVYCGSLVAGTITLSLIFSKRIGLLMPVALISVSNGYKYLLGLYESKSFISAVSSLQSLCLNVSKLLRLLKETEILSTGQVTTQNVGAALYIPVKSLVDQGSLPPWKTLPHIRKFLANTLLDIIDLLKSSCAEARKIIPNWLFIEGYELSNESSLSIIDRLRDSADDISLKDLQLLNDSYLILQSELLKWIGFCICPSVWRPSDPNYNSSRIQILNLFCSVSSQLNAISFKVKNQYNIENIFMESKQTGNLKAMNKSIMPTEMNCAQSELHKLYLLILSMLTRLKSLEDQLETNMNSVHDSEFEKLRETISDQMKSVRDELRLAVKMFDDICLHSFQKQKSRLINVDGKSAEELSASDTNTVCLKNPPEESICKSDGFTDSLDEVYLAVSDFVHNELEKDWTNESEPMIPNTLLAELSTTLKPIKENFKEREKAALERVGLEDIEDESDHNDATDKNLLANSLSSKPSRKIKNKKRITSLPLSDSEDTEFYAIEKRNPIQNASIVKEDSNVNCTVLNDKSIASMIALKSQKWGLAEEEYYSDD